MLNNKILTIIEEDNVVKEINNKKRDFHRIEEVYDALKWRIARNPVSGTEIDNNDMFLLSSADNIILDGVPRIVLLYSFNDNEANIIGIKIE